MRCGLSSYSPMPRIAPIHLFMHHFGTGSALLAHGFPDGFAVELEA